MADGRFGVPDDRSRVGWWAFVLALAAFAAFLAYTFVGLLVVGIFGYYATRPICRRLDGLVDSDRLAAAATVTLVLLPIVLVAFYAGFQFTQEVQQFLSNAVGGGAFVGDYLGLSWLPPEQRQALVGVLRDPRQLLNQPRQTLQTLVQTGVNVFAVVVRSALTLALGVTLSYYLLTNDDDIGEGLLDLVGGRNTVAYAYGVAVDDDLESIFFGNLLFVLAMTVVAGVAYWGTNLVAPQGIRIPMVFVLAFLTGVASLIPIVVGKVVYVPVVGYLAVQAVSVEGNHLVFVAGALVAYVAVLDLLPQTFLQPYITAHELDVVLLMFGYLLGPILFGWYGFFLLPILFVLLFEAVRIVLPELVHGDPLTPTHSVGDSDGLDPRTDRDRRPDDVEAADEEVTGEEAADEEAAESVDPRETDGAAEGDGASGAE